MLSVLSTLSGTIAVKHYFSIASGKEKIYGWCASPFIHVDVSGGFLYEALASIGKGFSLLLLLHGCNFFENYFSTTASGNKNLHPWSLLKDIVFLYLFFFESYVGATVFFEDA